MEITDNKEYINKMYDSALESQKAQLEQNRQQGMSDLEAQKLANQKQTDENLNRTYVEAAKAQKNYDEVQNAYGLSSGAMAQARLARDNQLQADLTALRAQQQAVDSDVERQRLLLSQQYTNAIRQAQADNDLKRAEALYAEAKDADDKLLQQQKEAAAIMASKGDYSLYAQLYGLTPEQLALLQGNGVRTTSTLDVPTLPTDPQPEEPQKVPPEKEKNAFGQIVGDASGVVRRVLG